MMKEFIQQRAEELFPNDPEKQEIYKMACLEQIERDTTTAWLTITMVGTKMHLTFEQFKKLFYGE